MSYADEVRTLLYVQLTDTNACQVCKKIFASNMTEQQLPSEYYVDVS